MRFNKVLIANRGEIAIRILRACRDMGLPSVAVFSEVDEESMHVQMADEVFLLGGSAPSQSYLNIDRIIEACRATGAQAVHPGYGFLAENPALPRRLDKEGLIFIGPPASAIDAMGDKVRSRAIAKEAGVPIIPGTEPLTNEKDALAAAESIGYPVMLKASAGGGGKGLRLLHRPDELRQALSLAIAEAQSAFGDGTVYLERAIVEPHHIEIQVLLDNHGHGVYLFERECSLQRRHQKVVEEAPSPFATPELRHRMGEAALALAKQVGYVNAGTVEFLVDHNRNFYFLEMNTRLQVEHPVTEFITGVDIVTEMIRVAQGEPLSVAQEDLEIRGHAIECRIYAEDPFNDFMPCPGRISTLIRPTGPGVRVDGGAHQGGLIPMEYDPLIAKLIVHGRDRAEAISRMKRAMGEYLVSGITTNIPFFQLVLDNPQFVAGQVDTSLIPKMLERPPVKPTAEQEAAAIVAAIVAWRDEREGCRVVEGDSHGSYWQVHGRAMAVGGRPWRQQ